MKMREKTLSILLVLFIAGVNSLTACGQNPSAQTMKPDSSALTVSSESKAVNLAGSKNDPTEPQSGTELGNEAQNHEERIDDPDSAKPAGIKASVQNQAGIYPGRDERGYHRADSVMIGVALADLVRIERSDELSLSTSIDCGVPQERNTAFRAARALCAAFQRDEGYHQVAAGLGGERLGGPA